MLGCPPKEVERGLYSESLRDGGQVQFKFDTIEEHAVFVELRDRGVFHEMAMGNPGRHMDALPPRAWADPARSIFLQRLG